MEVLEPYLQSPFVKWFIAFRHPKDIFEHHPSFLVGEISFYLLGLLTFRHACKAGGRYPWLWLTTILHGLVVESLSYLLPDIDNFWHAQSMVVFLGKRLPFHIVFLYPVFIYTSVVAVSRLHLPRLSGSAAVGLGVVLLDIPFDIVGVKLLWWSWHDTDPNIYDRHYWVPWTSYYFHAAFASSFYFLFFGTRSLLCSTEKFQSDGFFKELLCSLVTGLFAMPLGVLQFIPVYHPLHDMLNIHTEVCVFLLVMFYSLIIWCSDRHPTAEARTLPNKGWFDEVALGVFLHYIIYVILVLVEKPENIQSIGLHEPIGDCQNTTKMYTALGEIVLKRTYLCAPDYDEGYFDFHCNAGARYPDHGATWYKICGTPFGNHAEYVIVVGAFCLLGSVVYTQMLKCSGRQVKIRPRSVKQKRS